MIIKNVIAVSYTHLDVNGRLFVLEEMCMGNRKEEILIVALHLFAREGYEAVSVSQIRCEMCIRDRYRRTQQYG